MPHLLPQRRRSAGRMARQRGLTDSLPAQMVVLMVVAGAMSVAVLALSFVLPARLLSGPTRRRNLAVVGAFWLGLIAWFFMKPSMDGHRRLATFAECDVQVPRLPAAIDTDSLADEGAALPDAPAGPGGRKVNGQLWRVPLAALPPWD